MYIKSQLDFSDWKLQTNSYVWSFCAWKFSNFMSNLVCEKSLLYLCLNYKFKVAKAKARLRSLLG